MQTGTNFPVNAIQHSLELFTPHNTYLDGQRLFYSYFKEIPSIKTVDKLQCRKLLEWMEAAMQEEIIHKHSSECYSHTRRKMMYEDVFYLLKNKILVNVEVNRVEILYAYGNEAGAQLLLNAFMKFRRKARKAAHISLVTSGSCGLNATSIKMVKPKLQIDRHYNDDLLPVHDKVLKKMRSKNESALFLFHGKPGTGKSTYIRYLLHQQNKKVIFMPPKLAGNLDLPELGAFLVENPDTIFIIEDAEELIVSRDGHRNSSISMLLNLTDGLLGKSLGIQIIASFNTHINNIDKALLRKGRLTGMYEFKELSIEKSKELLIERGYKDYTVTQPMTLAEIYNVEEKGFIFKERNAIGFCA